MATRIEDLPVNDPNLITEWLDRFEFCCGIHDAILSADTDEIRATRKKDLFLHSIGREAYSLLRSYLAPEEPNTKTLAQLKQCIRTNLVPTPSATSEAYKLAKMVQEPNETLNLFMSRIKNQAVKCKRANNRHGPFVFDPNSCGT